MSTMTSYKMIDKSYEICEKPFWDVLNYSVPGIVDAIENRILKLQQALETEVRDNPHFCEDYTMLHHQNYVLECISGQTNFKLTYGDVDHYLSFGFWSMLYLRISDKKCFRLVTKIQNIFRVTMELFPSCFAFENHSLEDFDMEFVKAVHRKVGNGIITNAGEFREHCAAPAGVLFEYVKPHMIEENLEQLLADCRLVFSRAEISFLDAVKYGASFLERFLYIHPFSNGNGRTARLLLSWLLRQFTVVPLSLYTSGERREIYLSCLSEARYENNKPCLLARFILEAIEREYVDTCYALDVDMH